MQYKLDLIGQHAMELFPFIPFPAQPVPEVWLAGDYLCWRPGGTKSVPSFRRMLYDFRNLRDKDSVLAFAKTYGPLGLCEHGEPVMTHKRNRALCPPKYEQTRKGLQIKERVADVLKWAGQVESVFQTAMSVRQGEPISSADWLGAVPPKSREDLGEFGRTALPSGGIEAKRMISGFTSLFLRLGDPRPYVLLDTSGRLSLNFMSGDQSFSEVPKALESAAAQLATNPNFAVLSMQLATAVCGGAGFAICSACGNPYSPTRTPVAGRQRFCQQCGLRAAWRLSKRKSRKEQSHGTKTQRR
jgi:hypothetical protein